MKNKTYRFAAVAAVLLAFCLVFVGAVGADVTTPPSPPSASMIIQTDNEDYSIVACFYPNTPNNDQSNYYADWNFDILLELNKEWSLSSDGNFLSFKIGESSDWISTTTSKEIGSDEAVGIIPLLYSEDDLPTLSDLNDVFMYRVHFTNEIIESDDLKGSVKGIITDPNDPENQHIICEWEFTSEFFSDSTDTTIPLPSATVTPLEKDDLTFALKFKTDPITDKQYEEYSNWYADFVLTLDKEVTFNANSGEDVNGHLSGKYSTWGENWVSVPFSDLTINANEETMVMQTAASMMG